MALSTLNDPGKVWKAITPNDTAKLPDGPCRQIHCGGGAGTVAAVDASGNLATFYLGLGGNQSISAAQIKATGTTATGLVAVY